MKDLAFWLLMLALAIAAVRAVLFVAHMLGKRR